MSKRIKHIVYVCVAIYVLIGVLIAARVWARELGQFVCHDGTFITWASIREPNPDPVRCARRGFTSASLARIPYDLIAWPYALANFREDPREAYAHGTIPDVRYVVENGAVYREEAVHTASAEGTGVQINDILLKDADPRTFETVPMPLSGNATASADPQLISFLANEWGKDARHIFWEAQAIPPADPSAPIDLGTFVPLSIGFVKDKNHVYEITPNLTYRVLPNADPATFTLLDGPYAKDAHGVYSLDVLLTAQSLTPIPGMDPATFRILGVCASFEKDVAYYTADADTVMAGDGVVSGADASTFRLIAIYEKNPDGLSMEGSYAVDKTHVYKDCGIAVPGANPAACTKDALDRCAGSP